MFYNFIAQGLGDKVNIPKTTADGSTIRNVLSFIFVLAGAVSVLMVVIGGIRYVISTGDPQKVATAKNTVLYSIIGLVISLSAFIITYFIFDLISDSPTDASIGYSTSLQRRE